MTGDSRMSMIWVNDDSTVMVRRHVGSLTVSVATRPDSDALWSPPIRCHADADTAKALAVGAKAAEAATAALDDAEWN
jgi:hypothetical protein